MSIAAAVVADTVTRVVKLCVDTRALAPAQAELFERHAGTSRAVWNWALALRNDYERRVWAHVEAQSLEACAGDVDAARALREDAAWRSVAYKNARLTHGSPSAYSAMTLGREFTRLATTGEAYGETADGTPRTFNWWKTERHGVNRFAVSSALRDLDAAVTRYYAGTAIRGKQRKPRKDGRPAGWPRFKSKRDDRQGFALFNIALSDPTSILRDGRRLRLPSVGSIRVHDSMRRLRRMIAKGGHPKSARFTQVAGRWYIAINLSFPADAAFVQPRPPSRRQIKAGAVGVDLGVSQMATLSTGVAIPNQRISRRIEGRVRRLQRQMSRQKGPDSRTKTAPSAGWKRTRRRLATAQHLAALERRRAVHEVTKRLTTAFATVCIEDLNVRGLTGRANPNPDPDQPGAFLPNRRRAKAGLNRAILDVGFGEFRRQLTYKAEWYGATIQVVDRYYASSKTCSNCGTSKTKMALSERTFRCEACGLVLDRDHNAARNIAAVAASTEAQTSRPREAGDPKRAEEDRAGAEPPARSLIRPSPPPAGGAASGAARRRPSTRAP